MNYSTSDLLLAVAENSAAMACLPDDVRKGIEDFKIDQEWVIIARRESEKKARKQQEERREKERKEKLEKENKLLCKGIWGEKVPRNRRFALCVRMGKEFIGSSWEVNDPTKWKPEEQCCAIDLVRGYKAPYWGYYSGYTIEHSASQFYRKAIKPILEAESDDMLVKHIASEFNFFHLSNNKNEIDEPFSIVKYEVYNEYGKDSIRFLERGTPKTWKEHQLDLEKEFGNEVSQG